MIRGIHGLLYSSDPDATRAFFRDKMKLPGGDIGGGWWIFDFREGDLGVHPVDDAADAGGHDVSFYCDDLPKVVADLQARGVTTDEIADRGYGYVTHLTVPGGIRVQLYQPKYVKKRAGGARPKAAKKKAAPRSAVARKSAKKAPKKAKAGAKNKK
ncbi:MAG TPA: VOC family protein [Polyangiaceae bacterium]|jgi:catechol 2,3-dioxygenase-like lactoylglutathione lyase family enzyme